ncbi:lysozyme inhibitor LprI family protein [Litorilituus lipolyticus]|uniref:DUF1311 domain-containing protein n=1 Tax=Litorilituus lipolyticus TaxID=2491017 RepID=A0A502KRA0_9GAMM|nr:lysozyme inhibitor LprI family protein [Litorilituus lipolyticus]TPH12735.1 DUF1311 domain-containing protein [Litorilituus lipolyticus]
MYKKALMTVPFLVMFIISSQAEARNKLADCEDLKNDESLLSRCLDGVIDTLDSELQTWINHHTFNLEEKALVNGRYSALKMFKRSQSNFISFRENDCRWRYLAISPDKGAGIAFKQCFVELTKARIIQLSTKTEAQ